MSIGPKISLIAWADRFPRFVFVMVPNERGRYVRTDTSVVLVPCPMCLSAIGEPCSRGEDPKKYFAGTHAVRRDIANRKTMRKQRTAKPRYRPLPGGGMELIWEGL